MEEDNVEKGEDSDGVNNKKGNKPVFLIVSGGTPETVTFQDEFKNNQGDYEG